MSTIFTILHIILPQFFVRILCTPLNLSELKFVPAKTIFYIIIRSTLMNPLLCFAVNVIVIEIWL